MQFTPFLFLKSMLLIWIYLQVYPEGSPNNSVMSTAVNFDVPSNVSSPLLFELNLTNISSIGSFILRSVATYQSVEVPEVGVTLGPVTDTSDPIEFTIGRCTRQLSKHYLIKAIPHLPLPACWLIVPALLDCTSRKVRGNNALINYITHWSLNSIMLVRLVSCESKFNWKPSGFVCNDYSSELMQAWIPACLPMKENTDVL